MLLAVDAASWGGQFLGRLHPLIVHFPIGLLVAALFLEVLTLGGRRPGLREGIRWLVYLGAASALVAAAMGWLLAQEDYGGATVEYHRWTGTTTAALALVAALMLHRAGHEARPGPYRTAYRGVLALCVGCLTVAGHLGATLTHGEAFLTSALPWNRPDPGQRTAFLGELQRVKQAGAVSSGQLDQLNLEVRAIFAHNCYKCHSSDKHKGDLALDSREGVMKGGEDGPILVPGKASESEIVRRLRLPRSDEEAMPKEGKALKSEEIELVRLWIDLGAHWTEGEVKTFREAELALAKPPLPETGQALPSAIDRFVDVYFDAQGVDWPEPVGDAVFLRRAYLDLVGLLPEPEAVDAFLADPAPDKRDRLVDSLLARDDAYAQHWLSFWNDLLRNDYTGTGFITGGRKQITAWLYDALRTNKPYDAMVRELVHPGEASEGFIQGIRWRGTVNASQRTEMQAAQNVAQTFLGLNLKCASCHNSFVSNLTLDQAYALANVFADTALQIYRCDKPTGKLARTGFIYPALGEIDSTVTKDERLAQLADLLTTPRNGRLTRTVVNRYWARLLGRGLVEPVDAMDNVPWSQDLLDWLAADLIDHDYDLKYLLGAIVRSRTYQLPSVGLEEAGAVTAEDFAFEGPLRRRLSAEQFADALSQTLSPVYYAVAYNPYEKGGEDERAEWVWYDAEQDGRPALPDPGTYYFRHAFNLPRGGAAGGAELLIAVDHAYRLYLNGVLVGEGRDWRQVQRLDVADHLRAGTNVLAMEGENEGTVPNPAGVLLSLKITGADGRVRYVTSNPVWKGTAGPPGAGWEQPGYDDAAWKTVRSFGDQAGSHYWGQLLAFRHDASGHLPRFARSSLVPNDPFQKALGRPTREIVTTSRNDEATLLQALELTNGAFLNEAVARGARYWMERAGDAPREMVQQVYLRAFGRPPTRQEATTAGEALGDEPKEAAVQDFLWAVVLLPEFQLIY